MRAKRGMAVLAAALLALSGCAASDRVTQAAARPSDDDLNIARRAKDLLLSRHYAEASDLLNRALKADPANGDLHFLNGFAYHVRELSGEVAMRPLADVGYRAALRIDPGNATAAYCAGLLALEGRDYAGAVDYLAQSLRYAPDNDEAMRAFALAAYQDRRPDLAIAVARELERRKGADDELSRLEAMAAAALGRPDEAQSYARRITSPASLDYVERRVGQWHGAYQTASLESLIPEAPAAPPPETFPDATGPAASAPAPFVVADMADIAAQINAQRAAAIARVAGGSAADSGAPAAPAVVAGGPEPRMAMVDLVIIQTEENQQLSVGNDLLNTLTAVVEGTIAAVRGSGGSVAGFTAGRVLGGAVSVPATTYSLNIANSGDTKNDILARPTLVVVDKQASTFNAGDTLTVSIPGSFGGSLEDKSIGLTVTLTPTFLSPNRVFMQVKAGRSYFTPVQVNATGFSQSVEISDVNMSGAAIVNVGETLVLSGLAERQIQSSRSGTPLLGEVPGLQLLFAQRIETETTRTVMFLITPREAVGFKGELSLASADTAAVKALKASEERWFGIKDTPNFLAIMHHFVSNQIYQEFRTGDVLSEVWSRQSRLEDRLENALALLHY